jgi:Ni,Fe-hydrogenase III large subunit
MDDANWLLFAVTGTVPVEIRLIHRGAAKDCPQHWQQVKAPDVLKDILSRALEAMDSVKLQRGVMKAIKKRKEIDRRARVKNHHTMVKTAILGMFQAGATHDEVMEAVNEAFVHEVQTS